MKKLFSLIFVLTISAGTMFSETIDGIAYNLNEMDLTAEVTSGGNYTGSIVIPRSVIYDTKTYSVTSIGGQAFYGCSGLTFIEIPNSLTSIGYYAFEGCKSLTSITIPSSVTNIGECAFIGCSSLVSIIVEAGNSVYDSRNNCNAIIESSTNTLIMGNQNTIIPNSVKKIGYRAFYGCTGLTSIDLPNSVTSIEDGAFCYCTGLTSITIPNSVTSIGNATFYECGSLTSIEIPNSITSIGHQAFYGCTGLTSVEFPNSVTSIGLCAFLNTGLTSPVYNNRIFVYMPLSYSGAYSIPKGIELIAGGAFCSCTRLTSIEIPNSVTNVGEEAFSNCTDLTSVDIPNSVTSIEKGAFNECTSLTSVTIPNSVTSIGFAAFRECRSLISIEIPNSITNIGNLAFAYCRGLTSVTCFAATPPTLGDNVFYSVDKSIPLYVLTERINKYQSADQWKDFGAILPISAKETETTTVTTTTTESSVAVTWPTIEGAASYELVIKDKESNVICTLTFNSQGQLTSIVFNAPSRDDAPQKTQTAGFSFTITGLEPGTEYDLTITAKNETGQELDKKNVSFHTDGTQGIEDIHVDSDKPVKILMDGHIYILRGEYVYDTEGKMVK